MFMKKISFLTIFSLLILAGALFALPTNQTWLRTSRPIPLPNPALTW